MGRYVESDSRPNVNLDDDFWRYDISGDRWIKISSSTAVSPAHNIFEILTYCKLDAGPDFIFHHLMIMDSQKQTLYVFGGRTITPDTSNFVFSGLHRYRILTKEWTLLRNDTVQPSSFIKLKSRIGHSMLFHPIARELYIFAGQRHKDYLSDFYIYEIETDTVHEVSCDYSKQGGPDAGFTQRATIDPDLGEFYVLSGLQKERKTSHESVKTSFWCYSIKRGKWNRVDHTDTEYWAKMKDTEPCPRFAHQLVYDDVDKCKYLFGGNPGDPTNFNLRLDDLCELRLARWAVETSI
ncbi:hypothetical protein HDU84_006222 [Entophlyctis sp. JEL0112]|nr:hypothetical protein HDU84_006222 [Entophlyctis sp. JEL0112]